MPTVTFIPDGRSVEVTRGETLLRAALLADVVVHASCGGDGTCGKCLMVVDPGSVECPPSHHKVTLEQASMGYVLGCTARVTGDVEVFVPVESRPGALPLPGSSRRGLNPVLSAEEHAARLPRHTSPPPVAKRLVQMKAPDATDNLNDAKRVKLALRRGSGIRDATISIAALRELPEIARRGDWTITAIAAEPCDTMPCVSGFQVGDTTGEQYAIAVDVGTTTVEAALVDLNAGEIVAQAAERNAQGRLGDDVISRVVASTRPGGKDELHSLIVGTVADLSQRVLDEAGVSCEEVVCYYAAGNTVMTHLFLGISPEFIRMAPYAAAASTFPWMSARELGLPAGRATRLIALPCPASWLGGDIVAGVTAAGMPWTDRLTLFIDVGTNGEIVLGNSEWLVATSCSAGPAFEGGGILHGMRAALGAIEQVRVDDDTLEPSILTVGGVKPLGICGSGLIDCISELFLCGALDRSGCFDMDRGSAFLRAGVAGPEYVLVDAASSGTGRDIVLTERDVDQLLRAKAAIHAGVNVLVESLDISLDAIEEVVVAGGFGRHLDLDRVMALGMVPEFDSDKFVFLGNSSLLGAVHVALSREVLRTARRVASMTTYLELSVNAGFTDHFISALFFPHTDLAQFPRTESIRQQRTRAKAVT